MAKKLVRPFVRLYTDHLLNRQAQINLYFAHLLHDNIRETARLQVELQALRHRLGWQTPGSAGGRGAAIEADRPRRPALREEVVGGAELHARWIAQRAGRARTRSRS